MTEERLHRMVDGEKIYLTDEEEVLVRAEWAANEIIQNKENIISQIKSLEVQQTKTLIRKAALGDQESIDFLQNLDSQIDALQQLINL